MRPHWGIAGPTELLYGVKVPSHHFPPNLVRGYLDIFEEGMEKDFGMGLHIEWNPVGQSWSF